MARYEIKSKDGKWLDSADTIGKAFNTVEFYERNEPAFKPCTVKDTVTDKYINYSWGCPECGSETKLVSFERGDRYCCSNHVCAWQENR